MAESVSRIVGDLRREMFKLESLVDDKVQEVESLPRSARLPVGFVGLTRRVIPRAARNQPPAFDKAALIVSEWRMEPRSIFANLSPLDHRYSLSDPQLFERLSSFLSENASVRYCLRVELALVKTLLSRVGRAAKGSGDKAGLRPDAEKPDTVDLDEVIEAISPKEVYDEEEKTHHNIRALVNVMKRHLPRAVPAFRAPGGNVRGHPGHGRGAALSRRYTRGPPPSAR